MRRNPRPYTMIMDGRLVGFYKTEKEAVEVAHQINVNRVRSGGPEKKASIKIVYEQRDEPTRTVFEEVVQHEKT